MENVDKEILDRRGINSKNTCFITLKDHDENLCLCTSLKINQWKNTASAIECFKRLEQKHLYKFIMFNIKDFYLSIQEELLNKGLRFAPE